MSGEPENIDDIIALLKEKGFVTKKQMHEAIEKAQEQPPPPDPYDLLRYNCNQCGHAMSQREVDQVNFLDEGCPSCGAHGNVLIKQTVESTE